MNNPKTLVLLTIFFWSFGSLLTRLISIDSQLLSLNLLFFFSFIFFIIYFYQQYKQNIFKELKRIKLQYLFFGLFGYFFYYLGLVQSFHLYGNGSETTILNYTFPIFTVVFTELLLRRKSEKFDLVKGIEYCGVLFGFAAVFILATRGDITSFQVTNLPALLWGLSAGIAYGIFSTYSSRVPKNDQRMFLLASIFVSWILAFMVSIPELKDFPSLTVNDYVITGLLAIVVNGFGYIAWIKANRLAHEKNISISSLASLLFVLPFLAIVIVSIFLKETFLLQPYFLMCLSILIVSSILCQKAEVLATQVGKYIFPKK